MSSPRVTPNRLAFTLDGEDYWADATAVTLDNEKVDQRLAGWDPYGPENFLWFFEVTAIQSTEPGSLWRLLFEHVGELVPFRYAPHGNPVASPAQPHLTGKVRLTRPPRLGGEASVRGSQTFEVRLDVASDDSAPGFPVAPILTES